jgi:transcriptional regulator with XRE-family HTH domain
MTQDELAAKLQLSQASISKLEKRAALAKIATLRAYVEGLGGTLDLAITLPDREVPIMLALEDIDETA